MRFARLTAVSDSADTREGVVWLGSRFANGVLGFVQVSLAVIAIGSQEAGRFFLFWTAVWLLATVLRFGADGILPRVVAEAQAGRRVVPSLLKPLLTGMTAFVVLLAPVLAAFHVPVSAATVALGIALATCWAATFMLSAALKAYGRVALSGIVMNTLWPLGPALAPLVLIGTHSGWEKLALVTAGAAGLTVVAAVAISARALGGDAIRRMLSLKRPLLPLEADVAGAAALSVLYELMVWVPVVVVALSGTTGAIAAAVFAAVRIAAFVSWPYNAVVATLTPRIAASLARNDLVETRRLLTRGSLLGLALTIPLALIVALTARPLLHVFGNTFGVAAAALVLIVGGRVFDAAAGPVGEALLVGRGTWLDTLLAGTGITTGLILGVALEPSLGATAAGLAGAVAFALTNALRLGVVRRFLSTEWRAEISLSRRGWTFVAAAALAIGIATSIALDLAGLVYRRDVAFGVAASLLVAIGALGVAAGRHGLRAAVASPIGVMTLILTAHFSLRPISLALDPGSATGELGRLGWRWSQVTFATVLGAGGLGMFGAGFILAWRRSSARRVAPSFEWRRLRVAVGASLGLGVLLWLILFEKLGGLSALRNDPTAVHFGQYGAGYGTLGLCLCLGAALVALQAWLAIRRRGALLLFLAACACSVAGSIALATRGPALATALAGLTLILRARPPRFRTVAVTALVLAAVGIAAVTLRAVRDYSQYEPASDAAVTITQTSPLRLLTPDLIEFDYLVTLEQAVPHDVGWLNGDSIADVPRFFVPRKLWPGKPKPLDLTFSSTLFGRQTKAGTPFTLPGEAWWNFRFGGGLAFLLAFGLACGLVWRTLLQRGGPAGELAGAVLMGYSYLLFTRPLGPMLLTLATAAGATVAVYLAATVRLRPSSLRAIWDRASTEPST